MTTDKLLWLAFEKPPHADAVVAGVRITDAAFVNSLLAMPRRLRCDYALQFRNYLPSQRGRSVFNHETVTCRLPDGICHFVDWRLAKWLSHVLPAEDGVIERTAKRIDNWLRNRRDTTVIRQGFSRAAQPTR